MVDEGVAKKSKYYHDTGHLSPTNFDLTIYMWSRPTLGSSVNNVVVYWATDPPSARPVRFRASGAMSRRSQVFDVHLVIVLDEEAVPTQTWASMGMLAKAIQLGLERDYGLMCRPIDRTVIDVDYTENKKL